MRELVNVLTYVCDYRQVYKACWYGQLYMYVMYTYGHVDLSVCDWL